MTASGWDKAELLRDLRNALGHLYDPPALRTNPLAVLLAVDGREDTPKALRDMLTKEIETLKPGAGTPRDSRAWRIYHILHCRFVEQLTQQEVAVDLGLGVRQLRRQERLALQTLADAVWASYRQGQAPPTDVQERSPDVSAPASPDEQTPSHSDELGWLKDTVPLETVGLAEVLAKALSTLTPLFASSRATADVCVPPDLPPLTVQVPSLRQALVSLVSAALHCAPGGCLSIAAHEGLDGVSVSLRATAAQGEARQNSSEVADHLAIASQLVPLSGGSLEVDTAAPPDECFCATLLLPAVAPVTVLAVDDNVDTVRLLHRYLADTRFRLVSTCDPREALSMAKDLRPHIILLDVMLPGRDGWEMLERLREHPAIAHIPVIICTILPQERLARLLGAADFLQKPISRSVLLSALERQAAQSRTESL